MQPVMGGRQSIKARKQESDTRKLEVVTSNLLLERRTYDLRAVDPVEATYRLFGEAVPVPLAYAIARTLRDRVSRRVAG
jgi:site-specific DNA-cytosine methylase